MKGELQGTGVILDIKMEYTRWFLICERQTFYRVFFFLVACT